MPEHKNRTASAVTVAGYLTTQILVCGRSQKEIAEVADFQNPNTISMLKNGTMKLPLDKVGPMAKAIGADPAFLLRLTMQEYMPNTWEVIVELLGLTVTLEERRVLTTMRRYAAGADIGPNTPEQIQAFEAMVLEWKQAQEKRDSEATNRYHAAVEQRAETAAEKAAKKAAAAQDKARKMKAAAKTANKA